VPIGSGLSSSAALEVATGLALLSLYDQRMERKGLALACQRAENEYVGMRCGIMDQFAACFGRLGQALLIDCRTLEVKAVSFDETQVHVVVANTMTRHALASSEYNVRRQECEECVRRIRELQPHVRSLRDVTWEEIAELVATWPENLRRRARHVTTEMARVHSAIAALQKGNFDAMGRLMAQSHASLDADYQVTSRELNLMVALAQKLPGLYGARMTGAGFGGCTVNLVRATEAESFATELASRYQQATGLRPDVYNCRASEGGGEV
jgi:galactokinase